MVPFEEALPEYSIASSVDKTIVTSESLELIKKSKLDYIKNYVDKIEEAALKEKELDRGELYKTLVSYYTKAAETVA